MPKQSYNTQISMILPHLTHLMIKPNFYANCLAGPSKYTLKHTHTHTHTHIYNLSILFYVDRKYMLLYFPLLTQFLAVPHFIFNSFLWSKRSYDQNKNAERYGLENTEMHFSENYFLSRYKNNYLIKNTNLALWKTS